MRLFQSRNVLLEAVIRRINPKFLIPYSYRKSMLNIKRISRDETDILTEGAEKKSKEMGIPMCIAVCDESGNLKSFVRMDGAKITSIDIAIDKAYTASAAQRQTKDYNEMAVPGKPAFGIHTTNNGRFTIIGGGIPLKIDGEIIGSVGISGGSALDDQEVAEAAIAYFHEKTGKQ